MGGVTFIQNFQMQCELAAEVSVKKKSFLVSASAISFSR